MPSYKRLKRLNIAQESSENSTPVSTDNKPKPLAIVENVSLPIENNKIPRPLVLNTSANTSVIDNKQLSIIDSLVNKAVALNGEIQPHRIRGRIQTILSLSLTDILDWGNRNLEPLQAASNRNAKITSETIRIDAASWISLTKTESCKIPTFLSRLTSKEPSYYEAMLKKTRSELMLFSKELETMKNDFFREITDLHLDAISLSVCLETFSDTNLQSSAQNRVKTLLLSHQTAAMLQVTIENSLNNSSLYIQQIDQLLSVTIPQWRMAYEKSK